MDAGDRGLIPNRPVLAVGRVGRAHGVLGEVRVEVLTDFPERRFAPGSRLMLGDEGGTLREPRSPGGLPSEVVVRSARPHGDVLLVGFEDVPDRTAAASFTGLLLYVDSDQAIDLGPDAYYEHQLEGCTVVAADGSQIGRVVGVRDAPAADLLEVLVEATGRRSLVPMVGAVVKSVDLDRRVVVIDPIPGLLD